MDANKFEPSRAFKGLRNEIDNIFDRFIERPLSTITGQLVPPLDISETDMDIIVKMDLPGVEENDVDVAIVNDMLTIRGEKKKEREEAGKTWHITERASGSFTRSIRLPVEVRVDQVRASFRKGVLEVVLPKKESAQARRIEIKVE
jgi:HSP20 family protein